MVETLASNKRKASKEHKCDYCNYSIVIGEIYTNATCKMENTIYTWKNHLKCADVAHKYNWFDDCNDGLDSEAFKESVSCQYSDIMSKYFNDEYESETFILPDRTGMIDFLLKFEYPKNTKN